MIYQILTAENILAGRVHIQDFMSLENIIKIPQVDFTEVHVLWRCTVWSLTNRKIPYHSQDAIYTSSIKRICRSLLFVSIYLSGKTKSFRHYDSFIIESFISRNSGWIELFPWSFSRYTRWTGLRLGDRVMATSYTGLTSPTGITWPSPTSPGTGSRSKPQIKIFSRTKLQLSSKNEVYYFEWGFK